MTQPTHCAGCGLPIYRPFVTEPVCDCPTRIKPTPCACRDACSDACVICGDPVETDGEEKCRGCVVLDLTWEVARLRTCVRELEPMAKIGEAALRARDTCTETDPEHCDKWHRVIDTPGHLLMVRSGDRPPDSPFKVNPNSAANGDHEDWIDG